MEFDAALARSQFPALVANPDHVYLDGPGGTQVPERVIAAMTNLLRRGSSNLGGRFPSSRRSGSVVAAARSAMAVLFNAAGPEEIVFGQNMTSLTMAASRALARTWETGDEIVLTHLDHDANVTPWVIAARERDVTVRFADFDRSAGCRLAVAAVNAELSSRTRLVAIPFASNALGSIVDVAAICASARSVGALSYVDAVHYAPHGVIDVAAVGCDFLVASAYKFFGPHTGILYGRYELLDSLDPYRVRPAPSTPPGKWETGTQSFESLAGVAAAVDYIESWGRGANRRDSLVGAVERMAAYERSLSDRFLAGLREIPRVTLFGVDRPQGRTPTFALDVSGLSPAEASLLLAEQNIFTWAGDHYATGVMQRLERVESGGLLRIGFSHYTLQGEVDLTLDALDRLTALS